MNLRIDTLEEELIIMYGMDLVMAFAEDHSAFSFKKANGLCVAIPAQPRHHDDMRRHLLELRSAHTIKQRLLRPPRKRR